MFTKRDYEKISFAGVGITLILFGAIICGVAFAAWILQAMGANTLLALPFFKVLAGVMILGLGYIILELELLRRK